MMPQLPPGFVPMQGNSASVPPVPPGFQPMEQELSWSDVPREALRNAGTSASNLVGNIVQAVSSPIETAQNLGEAVAGGVRNAAQAVLPDRAFQYLDSFSDPERKDEYTGKADAVGKFFTDRYGSMEGLKKTLAEDPVGFAADLSMVLTAGGSVATNAPGMIGKAGQAVAKAGSTIDPISAAGRAVAKTAGAAGRGVSEVLGLTTGAGSMPIQQAYKAGKTGNTTFVENMRDLAPMSDTIDMAKSAVGGMRRDRSAAYQKSAAALQANKTPLSYRPIGKALQAAYGKVQFNGMNKSQEAANTLKQITDKVTEWRSGTVPTGTGGTVNAFRTPEGFDALKQAIGEIRQTTKPGTLSRNIADDVYHAIKNQIVAQAPEYANAMKDYANASESINEVQRTFSLGEKASKDTALRKLQSVTRNNVNTNYGQRTKLMDELARYEPDLPNAVAGQALNATTPRGLARILAGGQGLAGVSTMNPAFLATLPAASPRLVGEASYKAGQVAELLQKAAKSTGISAEELAKALLAMNATGQVSQAQQ